MSDSLKSAFPGSGKAAGVKIFYSYELLITQIKKEFGHQFNDIPEKGKSINLVPFGNHARGAKFIDDSHLISNQLIDTIDSVCQEIPEFYFGRLDIMYQTWADLEAGNHFAIVEVNGAGKGMEQIRIFRAQNKKLNFASKN